MFAQYDLIDVPFGDADICVSEQSFWIKVRREP